MKSTSTSRSSGFFSRINRLAHPVVAVADGDTITVLDSNKNQHRIRLQHIDCPESGQAFGQKAKQAMSGKVFGEQVVIRWSERDRYDRILGDVYLGKRWVNAEMVKEGFAWHYKHYSKDETIAKAEAEARALKLRIKRIKPRQVVRRG